MLNAACGKPDPAAYAVSLNPSPGVLTCRSIQDAPSMHRFLRLEFVVYREDDHCGTPEWPLAKWCSLMYSEVPMTFRLLLVARQRRVRGILAIRSWAQEYRVLEPSSRSAMRMIVVIDPRFC
jgi:hypothetical protein